MIRTAWRTGDGEESLKLIRETCEDGGFASRVLEVTGVDVVKDHPDRRLTVRYRVRIRSDSEEARPLVLYGKFYRGRKGERVHRLLRWMRTVSRPGLRFPESVGYNPQPRFLLMESLPGENLERCLESPSVERYLSIAATGVAALHDLGDSGNSSPDSQTGIPAHDAQAEIGVLQIAVERMETEELSRAVRSKWNRLVSETCRGLARGDRDTGNGVTKRLLHRDLYPSQVLIDGSCVGLVDVDEVSYGEPELDVGNFSAHLLLHDLRCKGEVGPARQRIRAFSSAYRRRRPLGNDRLVLYTASALLRLASLKRLSSPDVSRLDFDSLARDLVEEAQTELLSMASSRR